MRYQMLHGKVKDLETRREPVRVEELTRWEKSNVSLHLHPYEPRTSCFVGVLIKVVMKWHGYHQYTLPLWYALLRDLMLLSSVSCHRI